MEWVPPVEWRWLTYNWRVEWTPPLERFCRKNEVFYAVGGYPVRHLACQLDPRPFPSLLLLSFLSLLQPQLQCLRIQCFRLFGFIILAFAFSLLDLVALLDSCFCSCPCSCSCALTLALVLFFLLFLLALPYCSPL